MAGKKKGRKKKVWHPDDKNNYLLPYESKTKQKTYLQTLKKEGGGDEKELQNLSCFKKDNEQSLFFVFIHKSLL